jgi:hypothetical protein
MKYKREREALHERILVSVAKIPRFAGLFQESNRSFEASSNKEVEERLLLCGDDEGVVLDTDGFNLGRELEFVSVLG